MAAMAARGFLERHITPILQDALAVSRVVFLNGARQTGKTTLALRFAKNMDASFVSLDDRAARSLALDDPEEFLEREGPLVIDEVQRGGNDLLLAIKANVDRDPRPGRFLLTGSTRFLTVPHLSESLAGRVDLVDLWPLSQGEIQDQQKGFIDALFKTTKTLRRRKPAPISRKDAFERVCRGGFPEAVARSARQRDRWLAGYVRTLTERDVGEVANIQRVPDLAALVRLLATRTATPVNVSNLANEADIPRTTLHGYLPLLETVYLIFRVPAWSRNITSKRVKQAKLHFTDSGLAAHLLGVTPASLSRADALMAGVILCVQLLVYPGFLYYGREDLLRWHETYTRRISLLVVPLMMAQLLGGAFWLYHHPGIPSGTYTGLVVLLWGITFVRFVPYHAKISSGKASETTLRSLVRENWIRTFLWISVFISHLAFCWVAGMNQGL